jgi:peptidoglycan hydrolase CwlO-like protein
MDEPAEEEPAENPRRRRSGLGSILGESVGDAVSLLSALPEIAGYLRSIHSHIKNLDAEVSGMHAAVERLDIGMNELRAEVTDLTAEVTTMRDSVERLEPHVADLSKVARPFKRVRSRLAGSGDQGPAEIVVEIDDAEASAPGP